MWKRYKTSKQYTTMFAFDIALKKVTSLIRIIKKNSFSIAFNLHKYICSVVCVWKNPNLVLCTYDLDFQVLVFSLLLAIAAS